MLSLLHLLHSSGTVQWCGPKKTAAAKLSCNANTTNVHNTVVYYTPGSLDPIVFVVVERGHVAAVHPATLVDRLRRLLGVVHIPARSRAPQG